MLFLSVFSLMILLSQLYEPCQGNKTDAPAPKNDTKQAHKHGVGTVQSEKCDIEAVYTVSTQIDHKTRNYSALLINEDTLVAPHILHSAKTKICYHGECVPARRHRDTGSWTFFKLDVKQKHSYQYYEGSTNKCIGKWRKVEQNPKWEPGQGNQFLCSPFYQAGDVVECDGLPFGLVERKVTNKMIPIVDLRKEAGIEDSYVESDDSLSKNSDQSDYEEEEEYAGAEYDDLALPNAVPMLSFTFLSTFFVLVNV